MSNSLDQDTYQWMLETPSKDHWKKIGLKRRAGVAVPLFSLYSNNSLGIGEFPDLKLLVDWCRKTDISIIQLLPINDTGYNFTPYDARSMFALDPMYLNLPSLSDVQLDLFQDKLDNLTKNFPAGLPRVNYAVKGEKIALLYEIYKAYTQNPAADFITYKEKNQAWLEPYALFTYYKGCHQEKAWWEWPESRRTYDAAQIDMVDSDGKKQLDFYQWLQWQLFLQMKAIKNYADSKDVLLMGDLPFLVSRDSADVWANQSYFKLHLSAGAPPDMYFADGQNWGMPPYQWEEISENHYDYLVQKLQYAEYFYQLYRIDHFVGIFRIWTIDPAIHHGAFDPASEALWEAHGKKLLDVMLKNTAMLPCAEDLGTVPDCSYRTLREYGLVGMDVQRWQRWWGKGDAYKEDQDYRVNAIAVISTHDMVDLKGWWESEAGSVDEKGFRYKCQDRGVDADHIIPQLFDLTRTKEGRIFWKEEMRGLEQFIAIMGKPREQIQDFIGMFNETATEKKKFWQHIGMEGEPAAGVSRQFAEKTIAKANAAVSIFSIQLLQDWLTLTDIFDGKDSSDFRINRPGTVGNENWSVTLPISLEKLLQLDENKVIKGLVGKSSRG